MENLEQKYAIIFGLQKDSLMGEFLACVQKPYIIDSKKEKETINRLNKKYNNKTQKVIVGTKGFFLNNAFDLSHEDFNNPLTSQNI